MKIRRFTGVDMRDAMRQVREALGADAVILESVRSDSGVEISAAVDAGTASQAAARTGTRFDTRDGDEGTCVVVDGPAFAGRADTSWTPPRPTHTAATGEIERMREEMRSMRSLLEAQLGRLIWDERTRQTPAVATLLRNFAQLGFDDDIARRLANESADEQAVGGWTAVLRTLVDRLPVSDSDIVTDGGIHAVIGPTGVGKTTTIAKLAARAALQYGPESVGLITTDTFRVAAREQLDTFGQIMGIGVAQAADAQALNEALAAQRARRLVLIDTAGMSQRDPRLALELGRLRSADAAISTLLAVPANIQSGAMQACVDAFRAAEPVACILTKTDEATSLGGAFSVLIRNALPLACVANGQRVPEDLHLMRNRQSWLAKMAVELMREENRTPGDDELARRFTEVGTHAFA